MIRFLNQIKTQNKNIFHPCFTPDNSYCFLKVSMVILNIGLHAYCILLPLYSCTYRHRYLIIYLSSLGTQLGLDTLLPLYSYTYRHRYLIIYLSSLGTQLSLDTLLPLYSYTYRHRYLYLIIYSY